jgi:hypothetical protein
MGAYARVEYKSPYLNYVVSYPPPLQREEGGEDLSYWLGTFRSVCLFPKPVFYVNTSTEKGKGRGES